MDQALFPNSAGQEAPYPGSGRCRPENQVRVGAARFSVLSPGLLRLEHQADGNFEDRASYFAVQRDHPPVAFAQSALHDGGLRLETDRLVLEYRPDGNPFHAGNLSIHVKASADFGGCRWQPGDPNRGNLGGTLRTLDECEGPLPLEPGVLSRDGWSLKDDGATVLFSDEETAWALPRPADAGLDWYFFGYGADYRAGLADLVRVGGRVPLPPRFSFGAWYSRYWPYSSEEFVAIADEFRRRGFPLDVMVLDMDWHRAGWTGYSWNRDLIPDPEGLLKTLHQRGLRTTMNLHPHDGVGPHEDAYEAFALAMGRDPKAGEAVPFDPTDRAFMEHYFKLLLHPLEAQGVDFWWMDWQQGTESRIPGLDPLMWLNHRHFWDRQRLPAGGADRPRRGMNFSRWGGWGDHRYPVHFSGDTHANWEVLGYLAQFTASAGNVGVCYWSHDLGGHFGSGDRVEPELYLRWLQFGALSPVMRIHSSRDPNNDRLPWLFGEQFTDAARKAFALRASLVPYLYTAAREAYDSGLPLLRPLYLHEPQREEAFHCPGQYLLGGDLLCVPASDPGFGPRKVVQVPVWFPEGDWYHWQSHRRYQGPQWTTVAVPFDGVALFARGGAVIPLNGPGHSQACGSKGPRVLRVYPGPAAERSLYEDDGESQAYAQGGYTRVALGTRPQLMGTRLSVGPRLDGAGRPDGEAGAFELEAPRHFGAEPVGGQPGPRDRPSLGLRRTPLAPAPAGDALEVDLGLLVHGEAADLYDRALDVQQRCLLALDQFNAGHALREALHGLASKAEHQLNLFGSRREALDALRQGVEALEADEAAQIRALAGAGEAAEAALRCLAGVSLLAWVDRGADGTPCLRLELRRDARAIERSAGALQVEWTLGALAGREQTALNASVQRFWQAAAPLDPQRLAVAQGRVTARLRVFGADCVLTQAVEWDGRAVKDWQVLGPVDAALAVDPADPLAAGGWQAHRFDPSRVARGLRQFYDLGDAFHCPGQACWALAEIEAAEAADARLVLHHAAKARVWIGAAEQAAGEHGKTVIETRLRAGRTPVLVRLENVKARGRGLHLSVEAAAGNAATDLFCRPLPAVDTANKGKS